MFQRKSRNWSNFSEVEFCYRCIVEIEVKWLKHGRCTPYYDMSYISSKLSLCLLEAEIETIPESWITSVDCIASALLGDCSEFSSGNWSCQSCSMVKTVSWIYSQNGMPILKWRERGRPKVWLFIFALFIFATMDGSCISTSLTAWIGSITHAEDLLYQMYPLIFLPSVWQEKTCLCNELTNCASVVVIFNHALKSNR